MRPLSLIGTPVTVSAGTTATTVTLPERVAGILVMANLGATIVYVSFGPNIATATGANRSYALLPSTSQAITISANLTALSVVTAVGSAEVQFQRADGGI